jgi:hypothetical protein
MAKVKKYLSKAAGALVGVAAGAGVVAATGLTSS